MRQSSVDVEVMDAWNSMHLQRNCPSCNREAGVRDKINTSEKGRAFCKGSI